MKKEIVGGVLAATLLLVSSVYAQGPRNSDAIVTKMQTQLNLTQDQVNAIKPIIAEYAAKRQQLWQSAKQGGDRQAVRSQMEQLKTEENQSLSQVLSKDQMTQWQMVQSQRQQQRRSRWQRRRESSGQ